MGASCPRVPGVWASIYERWWAWHNVHKAGAKVKRGGASVSLMDIERLGVEFHGGDFLPAVMEAGRHV